MAQVVYEHSIFEIQQKQSPLQFDVETIDAFLLGMKVTIPASIVLVLFNETARHQQKKTVTRGFAPGAVPLSYIQQHFKTIILEHLKEFFLKYCVKNFLYEQIRIHKLIVTDEPRLIKIELEPDKDGQFFFECPTIGRLLIHDWKYLPFKAPKRKNYKDIDRQVDYFIKHEVDRYNYFNTLYQEGPIVDYDDWVNFSITLSDGNNSDLIEHFTQNFWLKIRRDELENQLCSLFVGKRKGDIIYTNLLAFQDYFSNQLELQYYYKIMVLDVVPYYYFCFDFFKEQFKIKTNKDMHKKIIEVFSYSNDISQRRTIIAEAFRTLLQAHPFEIPRHYHLRQQRLLLESVQQNPDYDIYRIQKDFIKYIEQLAKNQAQETLFIDNLGCYEKIEVSDRDIRCYLNLSNRPKMKEFIYFNAPSSKINGQEMPIASEELKRVCLREKTLNHAIYHLTKK